MSEETKLILAKLEEMSERLCNVEEKVTDIQLTLENETNRNIKIIAEGHAMIAEKIDREIGISKEKEMLLLRVNTLENELRRIKDRINRTA